MLPRPPPSLLPALQPETAFPDDPTFLESLTRPRLSLLWGTQAPTRTLLTAATALVAGGTPVRLFDGGNAFDGYFVARLARRLARPPSLGQDGARPPAPPPPDTPPPSREPLFVLDLLATFYDESVPLRDSERLLGTTLTHLKRLAAVAPVVVGGRGP